MSLPPHFLSSLPPPDHLQGLETPPQPRARQWSLREYINILIFMLFLTVLLFSASSVFREENNYLNKPQKNYTLLAKVCNFVNTFVLLPLSWVHRNEVLILHHHDSLKTQGRRESASLVPRKCTIVRAICDSCPNREKIPINGGSDAI